MSEQELRDFTDMVPKIKEFCGADYYAEFVKLDDETLALRILREDHVAVAYSWRVCNYALATSILRWADAGGNWKEEEVSE